MTGIVPAGISAFTTFRCTMSGQSGPSESQKTPASEPVSIQASVCDRINYASWQNSVPLLTTLQIGNDGPEAISSVVLELHSEPAFLRPRRWIIDRLAAKSTLSLSDCSVEMDAAKLNALNEAERSQLRFRLLQNDTLLATHTQEVRVLARDEWGGVGFMPELLAAFVMPNDPAVAGILKQSANSLARHGHSSALDGYQSRDPARVFMLTAAVWSAVASHQLTYANPPQSFEKEGQKTRRPSTILESGLATCLDTTLLFASAIEALGLNPVIVIQQGHCFVGVWTIERTFSNLIEKDVTEVRKALTSRELVLFETTLITYRPAATFDHARDTARMTLAHANDEQFCVAIDVRRARMAQIRPLASHTVGTDTAATTLQATDLPLPPPPSADMLPIDFTEEKPVTAEGRIERWQRKLLDLSLRNRLLNFRPSKQTVPFLCPRLSQLEDMLASGGKVTVISLAEQNPKGARDAGTHYQKTQLDLDQEFATQALQRGELAADLGSSELSARLTELFRRARNDLAEGGSNTLFLAVGFLRWKRSATDSIAYSAPLLLVPVSLLRASAVSSFQLAHHEDDVQFNSTLLELLRRDFQKDLRHLATQLPRDEQGVDVGAMLNQMRAAVRDIPGFEVVDEAALSTFSFARYLMWKDLVDRVDQLRQNRVVRHLIENPEEPFHSGVSGTFPSCEELDQKYTPDQLVHPLPADSSQIAAIAAAAEGNDFVLIGPPGTGKSQTIANMIAQCLAHRKTVLFVAEKTAALDVVFRRLRQQGLGDFCLELHSSKAERRRFLDQMQASWNAAHQRIQEDWQSVNGRLKIRRDQLNSYVDALHKTAAHGWSIFRAMGVSVQGSKTWSPTLTWPVSRQLDTTAYNELVELLNETALVFRSLEGQSSPRFLKNAEWTPVWESSLLQETERLATATKALQTQLFGFASALGLTSLTDVSIEELELFVQAARAVTASCSDEYRNLFDPQFHTWMAESEKLATAIRRYTAAEQGTRARYSEEELSRIPVDQLDLDYRKAVAAIWPFSRIAKGRVQKLLQTYAVSGQADPESDLRHIRGMLTALTEIRQYRLTAMIPFPEGWRTETDRLQKWIEAATLSRKKFDDLQTQFGPAAPILSTLQQTWAGNAQKQSLRDNAELLLKAYQRFSAALQGFRQKSGASPLSRSSRTVFADVTDGTKTIQEQRPLLRKWTVWSGVRTRSEAQGLTPFLEALEQKQLAPDQLLSAFELAFARWWLPDAIGRNAVLRAFQSFSHEEAILEFRRLDDEARSMAADHVKKCLNRILPKIDQPSRQSELGLLRHQMQLQRPSRTIREVIAGMPESFGKLAPCLLMSPLSIAQYLPASQPLFDVVIFDEASQITTWDAIGAIARGRQTVIVGDPKQLPPTNFFGRADSDTENEDLQDHEKDLESILDEARASGLPTLQLNWHYRSSHESLIAFSNWHYYDNQLITFPSAVTKDRAVSLRYLADGIFDRGKSRTNRREADAIVADAVQRMQAGLLLPEDQRPTLGVITFNLPQQTLIQDLLDQACRDYPELEWFFSEERIEPTVVKNLENVQGDERDVMLFSIAFGPDQTGAMTLNFGPLNRDGGHRRLNVAVTRARKELVVYSSFKAEKLRVDGVKHNGVIHLKSFLDYADRGAVALPAADAGSVGTFESPFEQAVAERLKDRGWTVIPQIGVSRFRVDLGVVNPDASGAYLAGIECDGATYHSSATARDRDKIREQILRNLGWNIVRIWSPEWWYDCDGATEQVHKQLTELLSEYRRNGNSDNELMVAESTPGYISQPARIRNRPQPQLGMLAPQTSPVSTSADAERFRDDDYTDTLRSLIQQELTSLAPIREDLFVQRIARLHDIRRVHEKTRERILSLTGVFPFTDESTGRFLWTDTPADIIPFRKSDADQELRSVEDICVAELAGLLKHDLSLQADSDPIAAAARHLGAGRVTAAIRDRLQQALDRLS